MEGNRKVSNFDWNNWIFGRKNEKLFKTIQKITMKADVLNYKI